MLVGTDCTFSNKSVYVHKIKFPDHICSAIENYCRHIAILFYLLNAVNSVHLCCHVTEVLTYTVWDYEDNLRSLDSVNGDRR